MTTHVLRREQCIAKPLDVVFDFFSDAANLKVLTPPWLGFEILTPTPLEMTKGTRIAYRVRWRIISMQWLTEIVEWDPPHRFVDVQLRGPYSQWHHTHEFSPYEGGTRMIDIVRYRLPLGVLGRAVHRLAVARDLIAIFDYRAQRIESCLAGRNVQR
jgi:ligand-binding SRPBCC domain-containing protein